MKSIKIAAFLTERKSKIKPTEANNSGLQRIEKIDFDGNIYLVPIQTKTDMIIVKKGDLIISGINIEKGALAIYQGEDDVLASIHYSAYIFDDKQIDITYFKWFIKSRIFRNMLLEQTGSGIKKEIKAKHLLPIEIGLPEVNVQKKIVKQILSLENGIDLLKNELNSQVKYIASLRQAILQQAVEGKLCEQQANDEHASMILEKIKKENEKLITEKKFQKQRKFPLITAEENPFDLPQGWEWCRLGTLLKDLKYGTSTPCTYETKKCLVLRIPNIEVTSSKIVFSDVKYADLSDKEIKQLCLKENDILLIRSNGSSSLVGRIAIVDVTIENMCYAGYLMRLRTFQFAIDNAYLKYVFNCCFFRNLIEIPIRTTTGVKNINSTEVSNLLIPLPPLAEQQRIIKKVNSLMTLCDELEQEILSAKKYSYQLMESALQKEFGNAKMENPDIVIEFVPKPQLKQNQMQFAAAARGKIKKSTWDKLVTRAQELTKEDN